MTNLWLILHRDLKISTCKLNKIHLAWIFIEFVELLLMTSIATACTKLKKIKINVVKPFEVCRFSDLQVLKHLTIASKERRRQPAACLIVVLLNYRGKTHVIHVSWTSCRFRPVGFSPMIARGRSSAVNICACRFPQFADLGGAGADWGNPGARCRMSGYRSSYVSLF